MLGSMDKKKPVPKPDAPRYVRSPLTVSKDGKSFSVCATTVLSPLEFYRINGVKVYPEVKR